jgi:hypothetical protein
MITYHRRPHLDNRYINKQSGGRLGDWVSGLEVRRILPKQKLKLLPFLVGEVVVKEAVESFQLFDVVAGVLLEGVSHCIRDMLLWLIFFIMPTFSPLSRRFSSFRLLNSCSFTFPPLMRLPLLRWLICSSSGTRLFSISSTLALSFSFSSCRDALYLMY